MPRNRRKATFKNGVSIATKIIRSNRFKESTKEAAPKPTPSFRPLDEFKIRARSRDINPYITQTNRSKTLVQALTIRELSKIKITIIIEYVTSAASDRGTDFTSIHNNLKSCGFPSFSKSSLITKLNRLKSDGILDWNSTDGTGVKVTAAGRKLLRELIDSKLVFSQIAFLVIHASHLVEITD